jgi:hypothetical protein
MRRSPERIAWIVLFAALFACCALAVGVPSAGLAFYNSATVDAAMDVKLQAGILKAYSQFETENDARVVSLEGRPLAEGSSVVVGPESVGLLTIGASEAPSPTLTLQLYSKADVRIDRARLPRFPSSAIGDEFNLQLRDGRIQLVVDAPQDRRFNVRIVSDDATTQISTPGVYSLEQAEDGTRVAVTRGQAVVSTLDGTQSLNLYTDQRTVLSQDNGIAGVLPQYRNLIRNGDFRAPLEPDWLVETRVDAGGTLSGTARAITTGAESALLLERLGTSLGWGRTGVTQTINEDVRDRRSVQLRVDFQIMQQEIPVCGGEGSECPFMVRVDYRDKSGGDRSWIQGFYANGTPSNTLPDYIRSNPQSKHISRRLGVPETFESANLLDVLPDMQTIKSIALYAEGHAVQTQVNSVELLQQD